MRPFLVCLLAAVLPAASFASQEPFCEDKISRTGRLFGRPAFYDLEEKVPGSIFFSENRLQGQPLENSYWMLIGQLNEQIPKEAFKLAPVIYTMNGLQDFEGEFEGYVGRGEIRLKWSSGATIQGRSDKGDFKVSGRSFVLRRST
ncbi:hypothetical protein DFQ27_003507 [Actinomortierella ambigua]|uniref:Uncharacterized protein n=1 Tax=Actinomortierella ambigua TaxID=1343610 RepID=A0A9P6Q4H2_9FUNG|nr:hypothetical protein DFQ27_003507 [Actinomortierella ambigua]